jgi:hypothetical protein
MWSDTLVSPIDRARKEYKMDYATWYEAFVSGPEDRKAIEAPVTD